VRGLLADGGEEKEEMPYPRVKRALRLITQAGLVG